MTNSKDRSAPSDQSKKNNKIKATITIETFLDELEESGRKFRKSNRSHRALLRDTLETAQRIIVNISSDDTLQKKFVQAVKKKKSRKESEPFNWRLEIVAKATGARSREQRKLASKRTGVLEFLRERKVPVEETAATLKKEGIEKLYSKWCKRKKEEPPTANPSSSGPDGKVALSLWIERSDRDQLLKQNDLPLNFHPVAVRVSEFCTPDGAGGATGDRRSWSGLRSRSPVAVNVAA